MIGVEGPYYATLNDAAILQKILENPNGLVKLLRKGDVFVLDRGFRDVVALLREKGYEVLMPSLKKDNKQLTTPEANASRLVTSVR